MNREQIKTSKAPQAIGTYSQAIRSGDLVFISGQIPLSVETGEMVIGDFTDEAKCVMRNLQAVTLAAGGSLNQVVKFTVYLTDLGDFVALNEVMSDFLEEPFAARAAIQVAALPREARIEIDAIMCMS